jgi:hypothetical protein
MLESPQKFGSPVPKGHNFIGEDIFKTNLSTQAKVSKFDVSLVVEEDICRLNVSVKDFVPVKVGNSLDELLEDALDFRECELALHFEESREVVIHILKD